MMIIGEREVEDIIAKFVVLGMNQNLRKLIEKNLMSVKHILRSYTWGSVADGVQILLDFGLVLEESKKLLDVNVFRCMSGNFGSLFNGSQNKMLEEMG